MKYAVMVVALLFSCEGTTRIVPREVSRASAEARDRAGLVDGLEREVNEANRLRGEMAEDSRKDEKDAVRPASVDSTQLGRMPRLIVFTAVEWCAPCRRLDVEIDRLAAMTYVTADGNQHTWAENIGAGPDKSIQVVDISDDGETPEQALAVKYRVKGVPTMVRIDADGKEESRHTGLIDAETLCRYQAGKWRPPPAKIDEKNIVSLID